MMRRGGAFLLGGALLAGAVMLSKGAFRDRRGDERLPAQSHLARNPPAEADPSSRVPSLKEAGGSVPRSQEGEMPLTEAQRALLRPAFEVLATLERQSRHNNDADLMERVRKERAKLVALATNSEPATEGEGRER